MSDLAPGLLIAVPQMEDSNFARSVVLLVEHSEEGAMGMVINRESEISLRDIGLEQSMEVHPAAGHAFVGGPVQRERGFLLHRREEVPDSVRLPDGVFLSVSTDALRALLPDDPSAYRLCLGYAGWAPGQLEQEMVAGGWLNSPITSKRIFDTPVERIWESVIRDLGIEPAFLIQTSGKQ